MKIAIKNKILTSILSAVIIVLAIIIYFSSDYSASTDKTVNRGKGGLVSDQILVKYKSNTSKSKKDKIEKKFGLTTKNELKQIGVKVYKTPKQANAETLVSVLTMDPDVLFAEQERAAAPARVPNDPYFANWQGSLKLMKLPEAWDRIIGDQNVRVAILDTGISAPPDLIDNIGPGYNVLNGKTDLASLAERYLHGTLVAGAQAAKSNNGIGVSSVMWNATILPIKITDQAEGWAYESDMAKGLIWAADNGAKTANISFGPLDSSTLMNAADYFRSKGGVVMSAGGNGAYVNGVITPLPTGLPDNKSLITVSAVDGFDVIEYWSDYGANIDISAPDAAWVPLPNGSYNVYGGTSLASPHVAGVAGLLYSLDPTLTPVQIEDILKKTADDKGDQGWDQRYGWGRVNAYRAVLLAETYNSSTDTTKPTVEITYPVNGGEVKLDSAGMWVKANATDNHAVDSVVFKLDNEIVKTDASSPYEVFYNITAGTHTLTATASDISGNISTTTSTFNVIFNDTTPPVVNITSPTEGVTVSGRVPVYASASDNTRVNTVYFYGRDNQTGTVYPIGNDTSSPYGIEWDTSVFKNGSVSIYAQAKDPSNNIATSSLVTVTVSNSSGDNTAPTVSFSSPTNNATLSGNINITVNASDNVGVKEVFAVLNGVSLGTDTSSPYTFSYDTKQLANGTYPLQATAVDTSGNTTTVTININIQNIIDTTAPKITITQPTDGTILSNKPTLSILNSNSDNIAVVKVELYINGTLYTTSYSQPFSLTWNHKKYAKGTHSLQLKAYDQAGNVGVSNIVNVTKR